MPQIEWADLIQGLLLSGGGFVAGVIATATWAKAQGYRIEWPWTRTHPHRPH